MSEVSSDRLAELQERRAFLLRSLDDLDRERAAGDISDVDYDLLQHDYSRRAAEVLREIESGTPAAPGGSRGTRATRGKADAREERPVGARLLRVGAVVGAIVVFAAGAGVLVARTAGERTGNDGLTGGVVTAAANNRDAKVQALLATGRNNLSSDPLASLKAFDEAAQLDPTQVEALAYGGWVLRIVSQSVDDPAQKAELLAGALRRIDAAIAVDARYPDARAFRGILLLRDKNDAKAALEDFVALEQLNPPAEVEQLVSGARRDAEDAVAAAKG